MWGGRPRPPQLELLFRYCIPSNRRVICLSSMRFHKAFVFPRSCCSRYSVEPPAGPAVPRLKSGINSGAENPPWSGLDLFLIVLVLVLSLFLFSSLFFVLALHVWHSSPGQSASDLSKNPGPFVIVPAMTLAYTAMLAAMYVVGEASSHAPFWQAVGWRWPSDWWFGYMVWRWITGSGIGIALASPPIQSLSRWISSSRTSEART